MPNNKKKKQTPPPAQDPQARENQLINLSMELAEEQLRNGTATAQVITHFLKLGSQQEKLLREKLENENKLLLARVSELESRESMEKTYTEALRAMRQYSGATVEDHTLEDDEEYYDD